MTRIRTIILALDASTTVVGWCAAQGEDYLDSGAYRPNGDCAEARILAISEWVLDTIATYDPDLVAIEKPTGHHANLRTDRLLARVGGVIEGVCRTVEPPIRVLYVHPMQVKQTPFHKHAVFAAAYFVGKDEVGGDEADAIGVWQVALGTLKLEQFNERVEEEAS